MAIPKCPVFGRCGGCSYQHVSYDKQLKAKKEALEKTIGCEVNTVISGEEYFYRNRMDFIFTPKGIGFRKKGRWSELVDIEKCYISNYRLNELISEVRNFFKEPDYFNPVKKKGTMCYAVIRTPRLSSSISFVLNKDSENIDAAKEKIKGFSNITTAENVIITYVSDNTHVSTSDDYEIIKGTDYIREEYFGWEFDFHVQGFFQNNSSLSGEMHKYVSGLIKRYETTGFDLLDLFGGVGTFGIINSRRFRNVTIIENDVSCIKAAKRNLENNRVKNARVLSMDAKELYRIEFENQQFVIVDPPRGGMNPLTVSAINRLAPPAVIYISCNIKHLSNDLKRLSGYKIKSRALIDLFPQTTHSEAVIGLEKEE